MPEKSPGPKKVPNADARAAGATLADAEAAMPPQVAGEITEDLELPAIADAPATAPTDEDIEPARRPNFVRQPFGAIRAKLSAPARKGFHRHWFNDDLDRIQQAQAAGYTHVKEATGQPMMRVAGVAKGGGPLRTYLMEIPEEWFKEDAAAKHKELDEIDAAIRGGNIARKDNDERYVPKNGIKFRDEFGRLKNPAPDEEE